jgi:hypothetical protein
MSCFSCILFVYLGCGFLRFNEFQLIIEKRFCWLVLMSLFCIAHLSNSIWDNISSVNERISVCQFSDAMNYIGHLYAYGNWVALFLYARFSIGMGYCAIFVDVKNLRLLYPRRAWNIYYIMKCGDNSWLFVGAPFGWLGFCLKCSLKK